MRGVLTKAVVEKRLKWAVWFAHERTLLLLLVFALGLIAAVSWSMHRLSNNIVRWSALDGAVRTSQMFDSLRSLYTSDVVAPLARLGIEPGHYYEDADATFPLPATFSMRLGELLGRKAHGVEVRLYSAFPFPHREDRDLDGFERESLRRLAATPDAAYYEFTELEGRRVMRYASADVMQESCVGCHNSHPESPKRDWKVGDVRGALEVIEPIGTLVESSSAWIRGAFIWMIGLFAAAIVVLGAVVLRLRQGMAFLRVSWADPAPLRAKMDAAADVRLARGQLYLLGAALAAVILILDLSIPLGVAVGVSYVLLVLLSLWSSRQADTFVAAVAGTVFTLVGYKFSEELGVPWMVVANRLLAVFAIWVTAVLCLWHKRTVQEESVLAAEKQLAVEASHAKSSFLANMSHELRTPLNSVIGFSNVLLKDVAGKLGAAELQYLRRIHANGKHLLGLINSILDLSRVESGRHEMRLTEVDVGRLVVDVTKQLEGQTIERGLALTAEVPVGLESVRTDPDMLKRILINLVGNAIKFTEEGGVHVVVVADGESRRPLRIDVRDTGPGVPTKALERIFDEFGGDSEVQRSYEGSGLGLAISRALAKLLGFELSVESEVGVGSTFSIVLERGTAGDPSPSAKSSNILSTEGSRGSIESAFPTATRASSRRPTSS